ncbi:MAG TPA: linear amide C-N hydrolase [Chitinivibrionales bacterium]|nr:linear amide C-N hydrolase [Chitinivibrionales bacterium]
MTAQRRIMAAIILALAATNLQLNACTVFCIQKGDQPVVGRNYDWGFNECIVFINKSGLSKTAFAYYGEAPDNPAQWLSRYGSATFCQYGRENGFAGMNEAGLVVNGLYLSEAQYPAPDARKSVSMDQWIQYQLDNFSTVDEVVASDKTIRIRQPSGDYSRVHFFVTDKSGATAVIEHLNGVMVCHTGAGLPYAALTNDTYDNSLAYLSKGLTDTASTGSLDRFFRAATLSKNYDTAVATGTYGEYILSRTEQGSTQYSVIFDPKGLYVVFKSQSNQQFRYFNLASFDMSCRTPVKMLNVEAVASGDATAGFTDYSTQANETLILDAWENLGITVYQPALDFFAQYPEQCTCTDAGVAGVTRSLPAWNSSRARLFDLLGRLLGTAIIRYPARAGTKVMLPKQSCAAAGVIIQGK